ncbi:TfoX/Sxy family protein [Candidatus Gracilibacteria bacterium]|nr:TfoX/Sxy family protein [Candidatus Gracilibacteria bacterium]
MPKPVPEYLIYFLEDCLGGDSAFTYKGMFGGYSIYKHEKIFAVYLDSQLYFKVDDNNRDDYINAGSECFSYEKKSGQVAVMAYYTVPEEILENREILDNWIEKSLSIPANVKKKTSRKNKL